MTYTGCIVILMVAIFIAAIVSIVAAAETDNVIYVAFIIVAAFAIIMGGITVGGEIGKVNRDTLDPYKCPRCNYELVVDDIEEIAPTQANTIHMCKIKGHCIICGKEYDAYSDVIVLYDDEKAHVQGGMAQ